jgi:hypothetical protein
VHDVIIAADYPFLNILWSMIVFFGWVIWIWLLITILSDVFSRRDLSGWGKAGWAVFTIILPFLGVLTYLILHHEDMAERRAEGIKGQQEQFDSYVRSVSASAGPAGEIDKAKQLLDSGAITPDEFAALKAKALAA